MFTIYEAEEGIVDIHNNSIALNLEPQIVNPEVEFKAEANANPYQVDLFYLKSVLVSVGWNGNDDIFDKMELIAALNTPIDKQFNFMHNEKDIIGHITSSKIFDGVNYIDDLNNIPDKFDIIVGSVIYKKWQDQKLQERIDKVIAEIKDNKWFVSMECWFNNFDYGFITPEGTQKIIARNRDTAFLTKYLRAYGGPGEFKGDKIGRLIRNYSFTGKGLVDNPANKRSVILDYSDVSEETTSAKEIVMADKTYSQEEYNAIASELAKVKQITQEEAEKAKAKEVTALKSEIDEKNKTIETLNKQVTDLKNEASVASEVAKNKDEKIGSLTKDNEDLSAKIKEFEDAAKVSSLAKAKTDRLAKLSKKDVADDRAQALVEKFVSVSDEMFDEIVNSLADKKVEQKVEASTKVAPKVEILLDEYEPINEPALSVASDDTSKEDLRTKASAWIQSAMKSKGDK